MEVTKGFYDFAVPYNKDEKLMLNIVKELVELGFKTIAIEQTFDHSKKDAIKRGADIFPAPVSIENLKKELNNQVRILQRLTIIYTDVAVSHAMTNSLNLKKYNLIAGQPKTDAALTHCCTSFNGDIVTFDPEAGAKLLVNRKAYQVAIKRGIYFEIKYAPAISDSINRKDMIKIAHNYINRGKSKNIIFSSGATNEFEVRGPYDVANLSYIFGLSEDQGKNAIDKSCRQLFLRAESRRIGKTIMFIKATGPVCLSDTSEDSDSDMDITELKLDQGKSLKLDEKDKAASLDSDSSAEEISPHPNKKKKLS